MSTRSGASATARRSARRTSTAASLGGSRGTRRASAFRRRSRAARRACRVVSRRSSYRGLVTDQSSHLAIGAIVERGTDILLVSEPDEDHPGELIWALPGGTVAPGESIGEALRRRVAEETGLVRAQPGRLLWLVRYTVSGQLFETLVFEVLEASPYAAKGLTRQSLKPPASWVARDEAVERLAKMWFAPIREPA